MCANITIHRKNWNHPYKFNARNRLLQPQLHRNYPVNVPVYNCTHTQPHIPLCPAGLFFPSSTEQLPHWNLALLRPNNPP